MTRYFVWVMAILIFPRGKFLRPMETIQIYSTAPIRDIDSTIEIFSFLT